MAKVIHNKFTMGLSGKFGNLVFRQMKDGRTIVARAPDFSQRVLSQRQLTHQSRFQKAAEYARLAAKTQPLYAELAQQRLQPAYNIALSDWFHPPVIHAVQRQAGCIRVHATDNVQVARVRITIVNEQGETLEQGEAASAINDPWWEYETFTEGSIVVEAFDLAGNAARLEVTPTEKQNG
jgi:hypothetical protein